MGKRRGRPLETKNKKTAVHQEAFIDTGQTTIHDDTQTESDDELMDVEQNTGNSNDHESEHNQAPLETANEMDIVDGEFASAVNENSENESDSWETADEDMGSVNSEDKPNVGEEANIDEDSEELDADVEWMRSHRDQTIDEENEEDEDEDVSASPDAAPKDSPISKYLSQIQADLREQEYLEVSFYLMSMRYVCRNKRYGGFSEKKQKSWNGHDEEILRQLPPELLAEFPAHLTHRSAVSVELADLLVQNDLPKSCANYTG
ncbi:hypothetical protein BJV82DRAFT_662715 [Fennellomyces sp. T-0311]|nr:hypothetical protein BJV82DRAFT_662715 [Fennellomyces sp. T-0311]